ncbi:branched-chain amino acid ABC transporter permease [Thermodesulfobacteriota bacterium]
MEFFLQVLTNGILTGGVYALMALAVVVVYKASAVFNFAHGSLVAFSSFLLWQMIVTWQIPLLMAIILLFMFICVLSYLIQRAVIQPLTGQSVMSAIMATIALGEIFSGAIVFFWPGPGRVLPKMVSSFKIHLGSVIVPSEGLVNFAICIFCFIIFLVFFQKSKMGLAMRGTAEDHTLAQSEGISVNWIFVLSWLVAIVVAAVGGALMGIRYGVTLPTLHGLGMKALAVVILGGMESIVGAMVGGLIVGIVESLGSGYVDPFVGGGFNEIAPYLILIIALIIRPYGLFGYARIERV